VESTRVGEMTNLDKLILEIQTNGAITPEDAMKFAANILKSYYELFDIASSMPEKDFMSDIQSIIAKNAQETDSGLAPDTYTPIEILGLTPRSLNALINGGIGSIEQLLKCSEAKLNNLRGFGKKALTEVREALESRGLQLNWESSDKNDD
jgi:DNA-directed RNA polymerase subunit alpha